MYFYPVPTCDDGPWTVRCNFAGYIDRVLLDGHLWGNLEAQDPDGLGSVLPAITSVLFGVLAGYVLRTERRAISRVWWMLVFGCGLVPAGLAAVVLDPDQQTALDHVVRGADGRPVIRVHGVLDLGG